MNPPCPIVVHSTAVWGAHAPSRAGCGASPQRTSFPGGGAELRRGRKSSRWRGAIAPAVAGRGACAPHPFVIFC
jgi:hypothetical protein